MLSKGQLKLITSLQQKKYRTKLGLFTAEGIKLVDELLHSALELQHLYYTEGYEVEEIFRDRATFISEKELKKISSLKTPNKVLAVFKMPQNKLLVKKGLILVLDEINDPGNLGTIIRLCDWFGVQQLICSHHTVDCYNTKVVQATMGSLARVDIHYIDLVKFIKETSLPVYGAVMDGRTVYETTLKKDAILIMGNEANGISQEIISLLTDKITIPKSGNQLTESLNVATATAILLSEFARR